ncbi:hypothetical protein L484_020653 [Morus notabilis]|uniref:PsbP C-terminal domain-containing protein n=1 Tax=Morus notabilis TaxID=981085 RepID=W9SJL0_9ROSA|nr:uncharacterized protein LOC21403542 [Morus notabilis]EXC31825.1 hypothetical protein L484_020653 [Morus notabilis]
MAILLSLSPPNPVFPKIPSLLTPNPNSTFSSITTTSRRHSILKITSLFVISFAPQQFSLARSSEQAPAPALAKPSLSGIVNTKSWFQFVGNGFAIRIPPQFEDIMEPEDFDAGLSLYGDKAKPKTFAARFASPDGSEVLSVIVRPTNQLKITFLEATDVTDLGSLKEAARIFIPGGATLYSARTLKIKEEEGYRTYYFYEFGRDDQHVALVAAVNSGKAIIAGATAPQSKWDDDGMKLRSAAISMTVL